MRGVIAALVAAPWIVWAVVRLGGLERGYLLVAAMAFTPYAAATAWIPVAVALVLRRRAVALIALTAFAALAAVVAPRAFGGPDHGPRDGRPLSVMSANLRRGEADPRAVVRLVDRHAVELLSLQELTPSAAARLDAAGLRDRLPHRILDARAGARGSGILSRHPLRSVRRSPPPGPAMPEATVVAPMMVPVDVKAVHPVAPGVGGTWRWKRDLDGLPHATPGGPLRMLVGDFNATLDHRRLRRLLDTGYIDAADATGDGLRPTYRGIQIDRLLVDRRAGVASVAFHDLRGSDHDALTATVRLPQTEKR
jgi:endonuclease/exonuclease/phosphatase (EEP) superfamily protein YafD